MKNEGICLRLFLIGIFTIGLLGINNAYATHPSITSYVGNDPDDGDTVYSDGDTITINLSGAGNVTVGIITDTTDITGNFTFVPNPLTAATLTGEWVTTSQLLITLTSIGTNTLVVGTSTVDPSAGNNIGAHNPNDNSVMTSADPDVVLTGDFGLFVAATANGEGSGCDGDCWAPTLGLDEKNRRVVENGFTYNGNTINVERYFTPYPLITVDVGVQNKAVFKIYENLGPDNIRHFDLAFGLDTGQILGTSNVMISWDKSLDGTETISIVDPNNVLDNVRVITSGGFNDSPSMCIP